jgi:ASCH domain
MRALTIKQPWAWAITHAGKDIENRSWTTDYRGALLIHAGKGWAADHAAPFARAGKPAPGKHDVPKGAIIGIVDLVDIVQDSDSPWTATASFHWIMADPFPITPLPCPGKLGLWRPSEEIIARVQQAISAKAREFPLPQVIVP